MSILNILRRHTYKSSIFRITYNNQRLLKHRLISKRWSSTGAGAASLKSIDNLPGNFDFVQEEQLRLIVDPINFLEEKYKIAKAFDKNSPMYKMNMFGQPSVLLFSHDLVKKWQEYELRGQTQRTFPPHVLKLAGKSITNMFGRKHLDWRKNATNAFKPEIVDQYTPFIQQSANDIILSGIADITQKTGKSTYFCELSKQFAYEIGIKFVYGPLLSPQERANVFEVWYNNTFL